MVLLVGLLPGLVLRLALLLVGMARLPIMGIGGFGSLVAAATSHRRSGHHGGRGADEDERRGRSQKHFLKHKVTPVSVDPTSRAVIRPQGEYFRQQRSAPCGEFDRRYSCLIDLL